MSLMAAGFSIQNSATLLMKVCRAVGSMSR
jgi:hypothetical protein